MSELFISSVAFGLTTVGATVIGSVSGQLTIPVMLKCWSIPQSSLQYGLAGYAIWNAINDPLFAFIQDGGVSSDSAKSSQKQRLARCILAGAIPFGLAFLLPWFDWGNFRPWQYITSSFLFDGCFTFVILAQCGLFAELEETQRGRVWLLFSQAIASLIGASVSWWAVDAVSGGSVDSSGIDCDGMGRLQNIVLVLAPIAVLCFIATGLMVLMQPSSESKPPKAGTRCTDTSGPGQNEGATGAVAPKAQALLGAATAGTAPKKRIAGTGDVEESIAGTEAESAVGRATSPGLDRLAMGQSGRRRGAAGAVGRRAGQLLPLGGKASEAEKINTASDDTSNLGADRPTSPGSSGEDDAPASSLSGLLALLQAWAQVLSQPAFLAFVAVNFLQIAQLTASNAFAADFLPVISAAAAGSGSDVASGLQPSAAIDVQTDLDLRAGEWTGFSAATTVSVAQAAGPIATLLVLPVVWRLGHSYRAIQLLLGAQAVLALATGLLLSTRKVDGATSGSAWLGTAVPVAEWVPHAFVIAHRGICGCCFALFGMAVSDVAQYDAAVHRRPHKITTSVFALNALVTKPAESIAPMFVLALLSPLGYASAKEASASGSGSASSGLAGGMWTVLWGSAAVASTLQLCVWQLYPLKGKARDKKGGQKAGENPGDAKDAPPQPQLQDV